MTGENESRNKSVKNNKKDKKRRLGGIAAFSLLITLFDKLGDLVYNAFINGFLGKVFTSYTGVRNKLSKGFFGTYIFNNGRIRRLFRRIRRFFAANLESCLTVSLATRAINKICSLPLQYFGNFGLFFGVYTIIVYCIKFFIPGIEPAPVSHLLTGIFVAVPSIPLVFSRLGLANAVKSSVIGRAVFKHTFGFTEESFNKKNTTRSKGNIMLFFGLLAGISTLVIHPLVIVIAIFALVFLALIAITPEIGVLLTIAIIPFLTFSSAPSTWLAVLVIITAFFYGIKLIRGKRIFKLEAVDIAVLLFGVLMLLSSLFSVSGRASAISATLSFVLLFGYFLLVNLMRTGAWIKRCILALITSASIVAVIGIFEFLFGENSNMWLDQSFHGIIKTRVVSLFENPNILSVFLVMVFPFVLAILTRAKDRNSKFLTYTLIVVFVASTVFTWSRGAWIALLAGTLLFAILYSRKSFRIFGVIILSIPIIPILIPTSVLERFMSISNFADSSIAYRIYTWKGTLNAIKDYWFCGIGYGDEAFRAVYPSYSYSGIEATPHSHSLILQLILGMGVIGFAVFCIALFFAFQKNFEYIKENPKGSNTVYIIASVVSIASALIMGVFDYIWYNQRIFYLFWIILAIGCAFVRVENYEKARRDDAA